MMPDTRISSVVYPDELEIIRAWLNAFLDSRPGSTMGPHIASIERLPLAAPFSFLCGCRSSAEWTKLAQAHRETGEWIGGKRSHKLTWRDNGSGLVCLLELTEFAAYPAVEWVLRVRNDGNEDTAVLENFCAIDLLWQSAAGTMPVLHRSLGSDERPDDFRYISEDMGTVRRADRTVRMNSGTSEAFERQHDGRSSVGWLPFFNLQSGGDGLVFAIGWSGQWFAEFRHDGNGNVRIAAGMEHLRTKLHPGESIRSPRILMLYWKGEPIHGHNLLRQFVLAHHTLQQNGRPITAPLCSGSWGGTPTPGHLDTIRRIQEQRLPYDVYWVDAGWYGTNTKPCPSVFEGEWWIVGDWRVNRNYHPDGLRPITDAAHQAGMRFLLWIETERATYGTPVVQQHPEWFMTPTGKPPQSRDSLLLNLGDPEAQRWAVETVSGIITEHGVDIYREDFNFSDSLETFLAHDEPDRKGMTEIRFMEGLYSFWDELLSRHPGLIIDNCASGGRRIDLETISRSVALWRSDYNCFPTMKPEGSQVHTTGLAYWLPLNATSPCAQAGDTYAFRSALSSGMVFSMNEFAQRLQADDARYPWDWHRKMMADFLKARTYFYGDYYPLTACSLHVESWLAYQMHHADLDEGFVLAFRRSMSPMSEGTFLLNGLRGDAEYVLEDADSGRVWHASGHELATQGLSITMGTPRASTLIFYSRRAIP